MRFFVVALRDRNEVLFAFSLAPGKINFLTVMVLVLLIYVLYKSFEIDGRSFTHLKSFPLLYLLRNCIVSFIWISRQLRYGQTPKIKVCGTRK
jgi:hypothetical protein